MLSRTDVGTIMVDGQGVEYLIIKVNKANSRVSRVSDGKEGTISTYSSLKFVRYATRNDRAAEVPLAPKTDRSIRPGAIVTLKSVRGLEKTGINTTTKCVVLKVNSSTVSVVEIGGRADGVFYRVPESGLILTNI